MVHSGSTALRAINSRGSSRQECRCSRWQWCCDWPAAGFPCCRTRCQPLACTEDRCIEAPLSSKAFAPLLVLLALMGVLVVAWAELCYSQSWCRGWRRRGLARAAIRTEEAAVHPYDALCRVRRSRSIRTVVITTHIDASAVFLVVGVSIFIEDCGTAASCAAATAAAAAAARAGRCLAEPGAGCRPPQESNVNRPAFRMR